MPLEQERLFMSVFEMAAGDSANELARHDYKLDRARFLQPANSASIMRERYHRDVIAQRHEEIYRSILNRA